MEGGRHQSTIMTNMDLGTKYGCKQMSINQFTPYQTKILEQLGVLRLLWLAHFWLTQNRGSFANKDFVKYRIVQKAISTLKLHINKPIFNIYAQNEKKNNRYFSTT